MEKARPGQRHIPAKDWNEFRDFMNSFTPQNGGMVNNPGNPFLVTVKNVTGNDLPAFSVVRIDSAMYPDSSDTDLVVATLNKNVELDGDVPDGTDGENIAIIQEDIPAGQLGKAICSGATLCYVNVGSGSGDSAKSINDTEKLELATTGQARIIWKQSGTGKKLAYVILDRGGSDTRETFTINYGKSASDARTNNPALYTKGSLHYIVRNAAGVWVPASGNETPIVNPVTANKVRPLGSKLVVCQEDAPNSNAEYKLHYYTPEQNYGAVPTVQTYNTVDNNDRFGCLIGDHVFTNKCLDYKRIGNSFVYEPLFVALVQAEGQPGGQNDLYISIGSSQYDCTYPNNSTLLSGAGFPDIWEYDDIIIKFDCATYTADVIDYPKDYPDGTVMPWYKTWQGTNEYPGRGWEHYDPYGGNPPASGDANCIHFVVKVKTNAIT